VEGTGRTFDAQFFDTDASLYQIDLANVALSASDEAVPNPEDPFPPTVSIASARLTYAL
jgi:hypothetical protein